MVEEKVYFEFPQCPHQYGGWCRVCVRSISRAAENYALERAAQRIQEFDDRNYGQGHYSERAEAIRALKED